MLKIIHMIRASTRISILMYISFPYLSPQQITAERVSPMNIIYLLVNQGKREGELTAPLLDFAVPINRG